MTERGKRVAAKLAEVAHVNRRVELRIEGYLASREVQRKGSADVECPYVGWEAAAWQAGWLVASRDKRWP